MNYIPAGSSAIGYSICARTEELKEVYKKILKLCPDFYKSCKYDISTEDLNTHFKIIKNNEIYEI